MGNMKYATGQPHQGLAALEGDFKGFTTCTLHDGNAHADTPVTNVLDEHIVKSFRTTDFTPLRISFDFVTNTTPAGVLIEGLNFDADINIAYGGTSALGSTDSTVTPVMNKRTGDWGYFIDTLSASGDWWGIEVSGTSGDLVPTATYTSGWEVGRVTWIKSGGLHLMPQNWHLPVGQSTAFQGAQRILAGGKLESKATSRGYNVIDLTAEFDRNKGDNIRDDIGAMARVSPEDRYLLWMNNGDNSEAYLCAVTDFSGNIDQFPVIDVDLGLREVI